MTETGLAEFLMIELVVIAAGYALAAALLRGDRDVFDRPLLAGLLAALLVNAWVALTTGLDAFAPVSLLFGFLYGLAGSLIIEWLRRWLARRTRG
jgi:sugar phosphate permease